MHMMSTHTYHPKGYVALITVAVIMSAVIVIGITITILNATGLLTTYTNDRGTRAYYLADTCAHEAALRVKQVGTAYIGSHSIAVGDEECTIEVSAGTGTTVTIEATGNFRDEVYRAVYLEIETNPYEMLSWQETP